MASCQYCEVKNLSEILSLGSLPPVNDMPRFQEDADSKEFFNLTLAMCPKCKLVQIKERLNREKVFPHSYPYLSGMTQSLVRNFADQARKASDLISLKKTDLVVDIGSNDGSLLSKYQPYSRILGVEPTQAANIANRNGIVTLNSYFDEHACLKVKNEFGLARVLTACNVFAHIDDMKGLIDNVKSILQPNGVFISESHYLYPLVRDKQFDTIYHEHLRYYSFYFLKSFLENSGFNVFHVEEIASHGGSIRVWAQLGNEQEKRESIDIQLQKEAEMKLNEVPTLENFAADVIKWRQDFRFLISELRLSGARIGGIGAPSRASTLTSYAGLNAEDLIAVAELSGSSKIGRYMPGTKIPVIEEKELLNRKPTHLLLFSWHLRESIIPNLKKLGFNGKFIIPLPTPVVI
jgi:SAM-dependent methyltransferase